MDSEVEQIKREHFENLRNRKVILLVRADYGWEVRQWSQDDVAPTSGYDTPQEAAARALQLMGLKKPIDPQSWPEIAQIGGAPSPPPRS